MGSQFFILFAGTVSHKVTTVFTVWARPVYSFF
jgi:hypothetical protein